MKRPSCALGMPTSRLLPGTSAHRISRGLAKGTYSGHSVHTTAPPVWRSTISGAPRQGYSSVTDSAFFTPLVLCRNFAVDQKQAIFFVLADNRARAGDGISGARHGPIAHAKFLQCQRCREQISHQLCETASRQIDMHDDSG